MSQALKDEERARADRSIMVQQNTGIRDVRPTWVHIMDPEEQIRLRREAARLRRAQVVNYLERKIQMVCQVVRHSRLGSNGDPDSSSKHMHYYF